MSSRYRFHKVYNGVSAFAQVELDAMETGTGRLEILDEISVENLQDGEVDRSINSSWVDAVYSACEDAFSRLYATGGNVGLRVRLLKVSGNPCDTRPDALRCATHLALCKSLGQVAPVCQVAADGQWIVDYTEANNK